MKSISLKQIIKVSTFHHNFALETYLINLNQIQKKKEMFLYLLDDCNAIDKSETLNIH